MKKNAMAMVAVGGVLALVATGACAKSSEAAKDRTSKNSESSVTTNDNGSVSRLFTEHTVTTNGNMVTEHRRETRTNTDMNGNVLETSTSEYAQSYPVGDVGMKFETYEASGGEKKQGVKTDSFLSLKFGEVFNATNFTKDASEPEYVCAKFKPAKELADFDDYYVYVTPKTHKVAKIYACAKNAIEPGSRWRRHYLIEALEKRYDTWARLCSWSRPCYSFDIGPGRHLTACLAGSSPNYETVIAAWDDGVANIAAEELEQIREEARKTAAEKRNRRVSAAQEAF